MQDKDSCFTWFSAEILRKTVAVGQAETLHRPTRGRWPDS